MHFNHAINNPIMLDSENLNINEWEKILVNVFVILLFVFVNPIYAVIFCGFLNLISSRINFSIFSFTFAFSFALLYFLRDYSLANLANNSDIVYYILNFQTINELSWSEIFYRFINFPKGNEPLYWTYVKIANILFYSNAAIFLFFHYFLTFFLIAYLGKVVEKKFVIIILCILLLEYSIVTSLGSQLRNTTAFLLFFIGIFLFDENESKWFPRILIYSSILFHITLVPIVLFFEFFNLSTKRSYKFEFRKLYSKGMVLYMTFVALVFISVNQDFLLSLVSPFGLKETLANYYLITWERIPYSGALFNWFTYMILLSLWVKRKKLGNVHVFIASQYFILIVLINELNVPAIFGRYIYYINLGGAIIVGYLANFNFRLGFSLLMFIFIRFYYRLHFEIGFVNILKDRMHSEYMDPFYGLGRMIYNYDTLLLNFSF